MRVSQEAVDDDGRDAVPRAEVDDALVVGEEPTGRLAVRIEDTDLLLAHLRQLPVGGVVPRPERAVGEAGRLLDHAGLQPQADMIGGGAVDELLDAVDDPRERPTVDGDAFWPRHRCGTHPRPARSPRPGPRPVPPRCRATRCEGSSGAVVARRARAGRRRAGPRGPRSPSVRSPSTPSPAHPAAAQASGSQYQ